MIEDFTFKIHNYSHPVFTGNLEAKLYLSDDETITANDSWIATTVSYGPSSSSKYASTQFRHHFTIADPSSVGNARLSVMADDSAIIYLNGSEVARLRMPAGTVAYNQYSAQLAPTENVYETIELSGFPLVPGDNVLAIEVHQESATSSDQSFDVELKADVITVPAVEVDSVSFGVQTTDVSRGRVSGGGWASFGVPTPGAANTPVPLTEPFATSPAVTASVVSAAMASVCSGTV